MPRKQSSSSESGKHPYMKRGFFLVNRFWYESTIYSEETKERLDKLVLTFDHPNKMSLNLINPI